MVRNAWRNAEYSWFPLPTSAAGNNDDDTESDNESVNNNAADKADNELDDDEGESEENNESSSGVSFSTDSSVNEPVDALCSPQPITRRRRKTMNHQTVTTNLCLRSLLLMISLQPLKATPAIKKLETTKVS